MHHHNHISTSPQSKKILLVAIAINLVFSIIEAAIGIWSDSLSLVSDAGHNLSDTFALALSLCAIYLGSSRTCSNRYTYGYRKASVLIAFINAIILLATVSLIVYKSIRKLSHLDAVQIDPSAISYTALAAIIVNGFTTWLLSKGNTRELNNRGAFLHMLSDTLVSVGVLISGIVIGKTGLVIIDPILSLVIAAVILVSTYGLLMDSIKMSIDAVPEGIDIDVIKDKIKSAGDVRDVHHIHIWSISTTQTALTAHLVLESLEGMDSAIKEVKAILKESGIDHTTLEVETESSGCSEEECGENDCHCC